MIRPSPGGAFADFAPAGPAHLADAGLIRLPPGGRERNFRGLRPRDLWGLPGPKPRVHFCTHKSEPKKRQPPLGWTPALSNRTLAKEHCAATESLFCLRLPRHRSGDIPTPPVGPRDDRHFLSCKTNRWLYPLRGRQPKSDKKPSRDQIPEGFSGSVAEHHQNLIVTD